MLILPDARCLGKQEVDYLGSYAASGKTLIITGETGKYDETGASRDSNPVHKLLGITNPAEKKPAELHLISELPRPSILCSIAKEFDHQAASGAGGERIRQAKESLRGRSPEVSGLQPAVQVEASPFLATQIASVGDKIEVFLANFKG